MRSIAVGCETDTKRSICGLGIVFLKFEGSGIVHAVTNVVEKQYINYQLDALIIIYS